MIFSYRVQHIFQDIEFIYARSTTNFDSSQCFLVNNSLTKEKCWPKNAWEVSSRIYEYRNIFGTPWLTFFLCVQRSPFYEIIAKRKRQVANQQG